MTITLLDHYKGAMVGVHVGDSIGAPYETWGPRKIAADIEARGGLKFFEYPNPWVKDRGEAIMPIGRPTDDSDQTADLARSLIECNGLDPEHLRESLRDSVVRNKSRLWSGVSDGAGGTTRKALSDDPEKVEAARTNNIGTNGSLMRSVPMALWLRGKMDVDTVPNKGSSHQSTPVGLIHQMSDVTHTHPHAKETCLFYSWCINLIFAHAGRPKPRHESMRPVGPVSHRVISRLSDDYDYPYDPGAWPTRGTAEFSLYAALWCFKHSTSFEDGIEKAVRIGGDTDTYAAIAGGLLGAYYGYEAIPVEWRDACLGRDVMLDYADKLYEMNQRL